MRDFRDAKAMAQTLRDSLTTKAIDISHSESLELVSKMLGVADWNTLSAMLHAEHRLPGAAVKPRTATASYPAIPLRDFVPFPATVFPLIAGRPKTMRALQDAYDRQREVALAVQKDGTLDEPGFDDIHHVGILAQLLDVQRFDDGTLKVLVQGKRRVTIASFVGETGAYQADVSEVDDEPPPEAPDLIRDAVARFTNYTAVHDISLPPIWPPLEKSSDPGRVADIIASHIILPTNDKQNLLATFDPVTRLKRIAAAMGAPLLPRSPALDITWRRALDHANARHHRYATLEHLLLALVDDPDASALLHACKADLAAIKTSLLSYVDNELTNRAIDAGGQARPTEAFARVARHAVLLAKEFGWREVSGGDMLLAIFSENLSPATRLLDKQGVTRQNVLDVMQQRA